MNTAGIILKLAAGIGLFLFAMYLLEESLKNISGRRFKLFLQRITGTWIGAVSGGAIVTGVLQSSSMVSLMVLSFVGAGVFTMKNAMAIILGANFGTTLDSWLVATLGFKVNIEMAAYPAVCIGGLLLVIWGKRKMIRYSAYFLFGFGLLFIGLSFMKTAMENETQLFDFSKYAGMSSWVFLLAGFLVTLLVQSSSVTMALALSAIHSGAIGFPAATAIVLGSETGSCIKIMAGAVGGSASKKRVAFGNLLFNITLTITAFIFLKQLQQLITGIFHISDPLIGLVTFSSLVNLLAILLFIPFLNWFAQFLERFFKKADDSVAVFIGHANMEDPEAALELFEKETNYFIHHSILFNLDQLEIDTALMCTHEELKDSFEKRKFFQRTAEEKYELLKQLQGELQAFYVELRPKLKGEKSIELNQMITCIRSCMYSVKSIFNIRSNISDLKNSSKNIKFDFFNIQKARTEQLYNLLHAFISDNKKTGFDELRKLFEQVQNDYSASLDAFYKQAKLTPVNDLDITSILNFNRELFTSNKAMIMAVKDYLLKDKQAAEFNEIVIYKA